MKLLITLRKWWCLLWHVQHRDQYGMGSSVWFGRDNNERTQCYHTKSE